VTAFRVSNRYRDLEPVISDVATSVGAASSLGSDTSLSREARGTDTSLAKWMVVSATVPQ
jgi:hypothetical protein